MKVVEEIWREIAQSSLEFPYEVSNLGNIRSLNYNRTGKTRLMKPRTTPTGNRMVWLVGHNLYSVAVLVLTAFVGERPSPLHVPYHLDGNSSNDNVENLAWTLLSDVNKDSVIKAKRNGNYKSSFVKGHTLNSMHKKYEQKLEEKK